MNEPWSIQLFGGLRVRHSERLITRFRTQKTGALLAFLAYHRQHSHSREVLIEMFWPDTTPESGRHNLSHALSSLRNQLEPPGVPSGSVIIADRFSVELNPEACTTDVADFEQALRIATQSRNTPEQMPLLTQALEKYKGTLLPDHYEDWIAPEQERLAQRFQQAAAQLIALLEKANDLEAALELAQRVVSLEPLREEAIREFMRLLAATGQMEAALRQYREYERALDQELGEEPGSALSQMAIQIEAQLAQSRPTLDIRAVASVASPLPPAPAPIALPTGTVTVLMTDIEGSTALWEKAGDAFRSALSTHHAVLRREFRRNGGQEVKEAGDSFLVVFAGVADALACAIACQRSLDAQPWPEEIGSLRVCMALHTGDVELEDGEYHGLMLHRAARTLAAGHGGQTLVSEATAALLRRDLTPGVHLKDLGVWRLRDVEEPERLFQVEWPTMEPREFPPLNAAPAHTARLPLQFTRFFGRQAEIERIAELLHSPETRLLTLTGSGGTGKSRLAIEAVGEVAETIQEGIWFVPLADLFDPGLIAGEIVDALGIPRTGPVEPLELAVAALSKQSSLLILDNFEHLLQDENRKSKIENRESQGGAEIVKTLLERVPTLTVLVTSRQLLNLPGERELAVPPLPTPNGPDSPERLSLFESVQLFVDRAQVSKPDFRITNSNAAAVAELCDRLEGIPLAIELAAARALVMTPAQMLAQLGRRFEFLVSRRRGVVERQRTLRAAADWSYKLLAPELQHCFAQLSVFRGGWTVDAAEAVCEEPLALDYLAQLRECSMLLTDDSGPVMRFRMLETLREFGQAQMTPEDWAALQRRHLDFFLMLAEEAEPKLMGPEQTEWLDRLEQEHDNLRAGLEWCKGAEGGGEAGLRLSAALVQFYQVRGHFSEGRTRYDAALSHPGAQSTTKARADALQGAGNLAVYQSDYVIACASLEESLAIRREINDRKGIASALNNLACIDRDRGDYERARSLFEEALQFHRELGNREREATTLHNLGGLLVILRDDSAAQTCFEQCIEIRRDLGDQRGMALGLLELGISLCARGDPVRARPYYENALTRLRAIGDKYGVAATLLNLGSLLCDERAFETAQAALAESLRLCREIGSRLGTVYGLERTSRLAQAQARVHRAVRLLGASDALREAIGVQLSPTERTDYDRRLEELQAALDPDAFAFEWEAGRAMTWEEAVAYALEEKGA